MRSTTSAKLTLAGLCCALCGILAQVSVPVPPAPITLCGLGVMLSGALLGPRLGAAAVCGYIALGAAGAPVFAGMGGGPRVLFGPTGGFLAGYVLCALIVGALARRLGFSRRGLLIAMAAGSLACYVPGTLWYAFITRTGLRETAIACLIAFLPGDALKAAAACALCLRLRGPLRVLGLDL